MGLLSWLLGNDEAEEEAEPLVLGATLKCDYGQHESYLFVDSQNIDLNNLPEACVSDNIANYHIRSFGICNHNYECELSMEIDEEWVNEEPQTKMVNGEEVVTTKSHLVCKHTGMWIRPEKSGQDGVFANQLLLISELNKKYPGLLEILENPYGSLYLQTGMYEMALQFLEDRMKSKDGQIELIMLYDPKDLEGKYLLNALTRLMPTLDFKSHERLVETLEKEAIQRGFSGEEAWDKGCLNTFMLDYIKTESQSYALNVEAGGRARFYEENRLFTSWAAESSMTMAYGTYMYSAMLSAGVAESQRRKEDKAEKSKVDEKTAENEGTGDTYQSAKSPMFGEDWNNYFSEKYDSSNITWKPNSLDDVIQNPQRLYGATQSEVASMLGEGWTAGTYGSSGTGWKFIRDDGMVFYHAGGGIHGGSYYGFSSGATGKVKIVGSDYIPLPGDKATVIYYNGGN